MSQPLRNVVGLVIRTIALASLLTTAASAADAAASSRPPNIVMLLADDLGWGDIGANGCPDIKTPNIDALAKQGVRFTQFYANGPECTPTRAAFLTGRYPQRVGGLECAIGIGNVGRYDDAIRLRETNDLGLPASETSIAAMLKQKGYATAIVGKWHLGYDPKFLPKNHGFDSFYGVMGGSIDYYTHKEPDGTISLVKDGKPIEVEGYSTDLLAAEAVRKVGELKDKPFFLYVPFNAPHDPFQGPGDYKEKPGRPTYIKMVERMDWAVGEIVNAIDAQGLADNTILVFNSDNGGPKYSRNDPLKGRKGQTFEGGIRVPCIARWPGVLPAGETSDLIGATMDLTASFAKAAGVAPASNRPFDGVDLLGAVATKAPLPDRAIGWRKRRGEQTNTGLRYGNLKFVRERDGDKTSEYLYDLSNDIAEAHDLSKTRPDDFAKMKARVADWEQMVKPIR